MTSPPSCSCGPGNADDLADEVGLGRLRDVQHLLRDLVERLDERRVRYTRDLDRA